MTSPAAEHEDVVPSFSVYPIVALGRARFARGERGDVFTAVSGVHVRRGPAVARCPWFVTSTRCMSCTHVAAVKTSSAEHVVVVCPSIVDSEYPVFARRERARPVMGERVHVVAVDDVLATVAAGSLGAVGWVRVLARIPSRTSPESESPPCTTSSFAQLIVESEYPVVTHGFARSPPTRAR